MNEKDIWAIVLENLQKNYSFTNLTMDLWFKRMNLEVLTPERVYFSTDNDIVKNMVESKYAQYIRNEMKEVLSYDIEVSVISCEKLPFKVQYEALVNKKNSEEIKKVEQMLEVEASSESDLEDYRYKTSTYTDNPHIFISPSLPEYSPEYTFENFVVGSSNNLAYNMARSVAQRPASVANPLFVYGAPGLGKTHLLYAITKEISASHPEFSIIYAKGEDFTNELIESLTNKTSILFREKYRTADVLLMDDIQFIAGKESIQEEFFHTYEALYEAGKQIIVTSDRLPKDIKTLADRLRSRFEHGIIVDIQPPDLELRVAIFKKKAQTLGITVSNDVLMYLGENVKDNIRQIEGALKKMRAMAYIQGSDICMDHAKAAVNDILTAKATAITSEKVIGYVSQRFNIPFEDIVGKRRTDNIVNARQMAIFLLRELTDMSLESIGKIFNRDHATVVSSVNKIKGRIKTDSAFEAQTQDMIKDLKATAGY